MTSEPRPRRPGVGAYLRALATLIAREPFVQFVLMGALIFALYAWRDQREEGAPPAVSAAPADRTVRVRPADLETLKASFRLAWRREPDRDELGDLVETFIGEEILFREGLALGLDRDDAVVRRRVIEKMTILARPGAPSPDPASPELRRWYERYPHRFRQPAQLSFEQRFFDPKVRPDAAADARAALAALANPADLGGLTTGDEFMLPREMPERTDLQVVHLYGPDFLAGVNAAPVGAWSGPVTSQYGQHLVYVKKRTPGRTPRFEEVEKQVRADWLTIATRGTKSAAETLLPRYEVKLDEAAKEALAGAKALELFLERKQ